MASCSDDFPLLAPSDHSHTQAPHSLSHAPPQHHHQTFSSHLFSTTAAAESNQKAIIAGNEDIADENSGEPSFYSQENDVGTLPNEKRDSYYYKKLKTAAESDSGGTYRADYRRDREEWSDSAIECLLDAYTEKFNQLNRGNLRGRDWEEVAEIVSLRCDKQKSGKTVEQCKNKIDNLKKRYKVELKRTSTAGLTISNWHWFKKIEQIVGNSASFKGSSDEDRPGGASAVMLRQSKRYGEVYFMSTVSKYVVLVSRMSRVFPDVPCSHLNERVV